VIVLSRINQRLGFRVSWEGVGDGSWPAMATGDVVDSRGCIFDYNESHQAFELHLFVLNILVACL